MALKLDDGAIYNGLKEIAGVMQKSERSLRRLARRDGFPIFVDSAGRLWSSADAIKAWVTERVMGSTRRPAK